LNRDAGGARAVKIQEKQDHLTVGGTEYDLRTEEGSASFIATLGLPNQLAVTAAEFLQGTGDEARDEMAQFIQILSEAEMGERTIDRMVLSGHSVGSMLWGDENGTVYYRELEELTQLFPKAMGQVKHVMLSACYSGGESTMNSHREIFPGAESIWAYHDSSPGTWSGAMGHMKEWEKATETGKDAGGVDPSLAEGHRKGKNVSTWNVVDGYQGGKPMKLYQIVSELRNREFLFFEHFEGSKEVEDPQTGPLREYYGLLQRGISHIDAEASDVEAWSTRRDQTIRLLYFKLVCSRFQEHYSKTLEDDYAACDMSVPDFSTMTRSEVLQHIETMQTVLGGTEAARILTTGLKNLDESVIPTSWV